MSTGLYTHRSRKAGEIVDAPMYNGAHQNQLDNDVPAQTGAHSDTVAQFRLTQDPTVAADGITGNPVLDLGSELEQLRFVINDIKTVVNNNISPTFWYSNISAPPFSRITALGARVFRSANQSISSKTQTAIVFDTTRYDTGGVNPPDAFFDISNPTRLTAVKAGLYQFNAFGQWTNPAAATFAIFIRRNGTQILAATEQAVDAQVVVRLQQVSCQYMMNQGDYVELVVFQTVANPFNFTNAEFGLELLNGSGVTAPTPTGASFYTVGDNGPSSTLLTFDNTHHFMDLGSGKATNDTVGLTQRRIPAKMVVDRIEAELNAALTGAQTLDIKFSRNAVDDNGITLHFDSTTGTYVVATGAVTLNQDDLVSWHATLGGGLATVQLTHIVFRYTPGTSADGFVSGRPNYGTNVGNTEVSNFASNTLAAINARTRIPIDVTLDQGTIVVDVATGAGTSTTLTTKQNDNATTVGSTVTLADPAVSVRGTLNASLNSAQNTEFLRGSGGAPANTNARSMFSYRANSTPQKTVSLYTTGRPLQNHTSGTGTVFIPIHGFNTLGGFSPTEAGARMRWPVKGKFKFWRVEGFADAGATVVVTLRINGVDTALTLTWTGAATTVQSDLTTEVTVNPGDLVDFKAVRTVGANTAFGFNGSLGFMATS